jgi:beta-lactamase class A
MGIAELLREVDGSGEFGIWLGRLDGVPVVRARGGADALRGSTMKLPVAMAMLRKVEAGELALDQPVTVHNDFASAAGGRFGVNEDEDEAPATWTKLGTAVPLEWLATEMITRSSNLATDLVLEQVGIDAAHAVLAEYGPGDSAIRRGIDDTTAQRAGISNLMSPAGLAGVLVAVGNQKDATTCGTSWPATSGTARSRAAAERHAGRAQERLGHPDPARRRASSGPGRGPVRAGRVHDVRLAGRRGAEADRRDRAGAWDHRHDLEASVKITTHLVSAPLHTPFVTALRTATHADSLLSRSATAT